LALQNDLWRFGAFHSADGQPDVTLLLLEHMKAGGDQVESRQRSLSLEARHDVFRISHGAVARSRDERRVQRSYDWEQLSTIGLWRIASKADPRANTETDRGRVHRC
jgi:hypothetical protein